jgi:uncharacterized protein (DUF1330 family)
MKAYIVANYKVNDMEKYMEYIKRVGSVVKKYNGNTIVSDHNHDIKEGNPNQTIVIVEFNSKKEADEFYNSYEYQNIINYRKDSTEGWITIVNQFDPNYMQKS